MEPIERKIALTRIVDKMLFEQVKEIVMQTPIVITKEDEDFVFHIRRSKNIISNPVSFSIHAKDGKETYIMGCNQFSSLASALVALNKIQELI